MQINKKNMGTNIVISMMFLVMLGINIFLLNENCSLLSKVIYDGIVGFIFFICSYIKLKSLKNVYRNIFCIYGLSFFIYSIVGCIVFILDNYVPRFYQPSCLPVRPLLLRVQAGSPPFRRIS